MYLCQPQSEKYIQVDLFRLEIEKKRLFFNKIKKYA